jgi:tRNA U34 5-carboxymethylaminomethyl modifying GTPase MnmE/TrmE
MGEGWRWLTPPAPAAIALLRIPAVAELSDRPLPDVGRARFSHLCAVDGALIDEVVITRLSAEVLEIACHGGPGIRAAVEQALRGHGLLPAASDVSDDRWSRLARAAHPAAVRWLLAHDDAPPFPTDLLSRVPVVLITGPANAGKSTLLNAWCGHQRALVSDLAGTTRDLIAAQTLVHGWRLRLLDSAGLRAGGDDLERAGQALVAVARCSADVVLYLRPPGDAGGEGSDLIVQGKADLTATTGLRWSIHGVPGCDSATLLDHLGRAVLERLRLPSPGSAGRWPA